MFYDNFTKLCRENRIAPSALARELGMSSSAPGRWKNGSTPDIDTVEKIADFFGVSLDFLIKGVSLSSEIPCTTVSNSAVLHGNSGDNVSVINGTVPASYNPTCNLTDQEEEILRIFRALDMRRKHTAMNCLYDLEDEVKEANSQLNHDK